MSTFYWFVFSIYYHCNIYVKKCHSKSMMEFNACTVYKNVVCNITTRRERFVFTFVAKNYTTNSRLIKKIPDINTLNSRVDGSYQRSHGIISFSFTFNTFCVEVELVHVRTKTRRFLEYLNIDIP